MKIVCMMVKLLDRRLGGKENKYIFAIELNTNDRIVLLSSK